MASLLGQPPAVLSPSQQMDEALEIMMQDANGSDAYNNTKVMMGHIEASKYLMIPDDFDAYCTGLAAPAVDLTVLGRVDGIQNYLGNNAIAYRNANPLMTIRAVVPPAVGVDDKLITLKIIAMNFVALSGSGMDDTSAAYAAMLRANWCMRGAYLALKSDMTGTTIEHVVVTDSHATLGGINAAVTNDEVLIALGPRSDVLITIMRADKLGVQWVTLYAQNIWCAVEHVFRVRSHHYKSTGADAKSYEDLYNKYLNACYAGDSVWPDGLAYFAVYHTAIHPFRIRALPITAAHFVAHGLVADAAVVRLSGSPCGNAVLTTTEAALSTLASEVWYPGFAAAYSSPIGTLAEANRQVLGSKYEYHIAAALYGVDRKTTVEVDGSTIHLDTVKAKTSMLASAGNGLISALNSVKTQKLITGFALSNARALAKPAEANPMLALKVYQILIASINAMDDSGDVASMLKQVLPPIDG